MWSMYKLSSDWKTDLEILKLTGSEIIQNIDYLIIRTPTNPNYHWGNFLMVLDPNSVDSATRWIGTFQNEFPYANWTSIGLPCMPRKIDAWESNGINLEQLEIMTTQQLPIFSTLSDEYTSRIISGDDWELLINKEIQENLDSGQFDHLVHEKFVRDTNRSRKSLCDAGKASWFGVFHDDSLVANLGIVACDNIGRYQSVETNQAHRRKGLASHLIRIAADWAREKSCNEFVIITESTNNAGLLYKKVGFRSQLGGVSAYKEPLK